MGSGLLGGMAKQKAFSELATSIPRARNFDQSLVCLNFGPSWTRPGGSEPSMVCWFRALPPFAGHPTPSLTLAH